MLNLTRQERQVILFLISMALLGMGVNFFIKNNPHAPAITRIDTQDIKVNINHATLEDLLFTRAVSEKLAKRIIAHRDTQGPFCTIDALREVEGVGEKRLYKLKELLYAE